ncbi:nuclease-related domain-containing DEAD/DEAH box helicase [Gordonia hongkongensis]|uniref:AAA family ATPase n=1 Tax=Gordonia hongkongensis TaxID=1701090 RepID=A0ABT6C0N7_9ACTN|nr:NERD domain-containing protein [Gordonia hongkongensis]MDF6103646.1 AAA family ATPase [Gordonia hongkongensis]
MKLQMVPADFPFGSPSNAERRVFESLQASTTPGTALHSLNLPEHDYKLTAELDFVLVLDEMVLALEVKGGRVAQTGGMWTYTDRFDVAHHSPEGPFKQVTSGMHSLRRRVRERFPDLQDVAFGTLVITPDVDLPSSSEWADEAYVGRGPISRAHGLDRALIRAVRYWLDQQPDSRPIGSRRKQLLNFLRPDFDRVPNLGVIADTLDITFAKMTEEQASRLEILMDNDRIICQGGAGTGKTFLAIETARRHAQSGKSTLMACRSDLFAAFLARQLAGTGVSVKSVTSLTAGEKYDQLVVDEGQDLASFDYLQTLSDSVNGGLDGGNWAFFIDPNRQSRLYTDLDPDALRYLEGLAMSSATLRRNCRNTRPIAFATRAATGADLGVAAAGAGPSTKTVSTTGPEDEKRQLEAWLRELRDQDVAPSQITIVSQSKTWQDSSARTLKASRQGKLTVLDQKNITNWPFDQMSWSTAVDIKGLENQFVAVVDLDDLTTEESMDRLYVAMSRPRAGLWVGVSPEAALRFRELLAANTLSAAEAYGGNQ